MLRTERCVDDDYFIYSDCCHNSLRIGNVAAGLMMLEKRHFYTALWRESHLESGKRERERGKENYNLYRRLMFNRELSKYIVSLVDKRDKSSFYANCMNFERNLRDFKPKNRVSDNSQGNKKY